MRQSIAGLVLTSLWAASPCLLAQESERPASAVAATITATATVESIDAASRRVSLRRENGEIIELEVSDEVRNLEQVEKGDRVTVAYAVGLVVALSPPGAPPARVEDVEVVRSAPGAKPGGLIRQRVAVTAKVVAIDAEARRVTLEGPRQTVTLAVADDIDLAQIAVGDQVGAVYEESIAVLVEPAPE